MGCNVHKSKGRTLYELKISFTFLGIKYICLHSLIVFYPTQLSNQKIICFDFGKRNVELPIEFYKYFGWMDRINSAITQILTSSG